MTITDSVSKMTNMLFPRGCTRRDAKIHALQGASVRPSSRRSESGAVLVIVLVLSVVSLMLITALLYLITVGTQTSGAQKRYRTAVEACVAGSDIVKQTIDFRGDNAAITSFLNGLTGLNAAQNVSLAACTGTAYSSGTGVTVTGAAAKIMTSTPTWDPGTCGSASSTSLTAGPNNYDFTFQLGTNPRFNVYAKIVAVREGNTLGTNTGTGHILVKNPVVGGGFGGEIATMSFPYLYTYEVDCENAVSPSERAKLSILYQY